MRINRTRRSQGLPHLAQLVEHLTVVGKNNVSADIRVSPVQVREWGPITFNGYAYLGLVIFLPALSTLLVEILEEFTVKL